MTRIDRQTLTIAETAKILGIGQSTAREAIRRGEIPALRIGRRIVVPRQALEELLTRTKAADSSAWETQ